jgi:hypothetical protein
MQPQDINVEALLVRITEQQQELLRELKESREAQAQPPKPKKDFWDRLTAIAPIIGASIMACIGAYATFTYNQQALRVQEIQTVEKFIPHLVGDDRSKRAAILAISSMGNAPLAAKVAKIFASPGTASALRVMAETASDQQDKTVINDALTKTLDALADRYREEGKTAALLELQKEKAEVRQEQQQQSNPAAAIAGPLQPPPPDSERTSVEPVHAKQPEPRAEANNNVEPDEAADQHARPATAESTHTKQQ